MNKKKEITYYSNSGKNSKITRELVGNLFHTLSGNLSSETLCDFISRSRVPNERELYGVFVKSIIESCGPKIGHIATEFQVERGDEVKGRVDLLFDYRSVSYLVELKVGRVNARDNDDSPKVKAQKLWHDAIKQLNDLNIKSVERLLRKNTVRLPIILFFYDSTAKDDKNEHGNFRHDNLHNIIYDFISGNDDNHTPHFQLFKPLSSRIPTRLRKTELDEDEENNFIYGFSLFAKQMEG